MNTTFLGAGKGVVGGFGRFGGRVKRIDGGFRIIEAFSKRADSVFGGKRGGAEKAKNQGGTERLLRRGRNRAPGGLQKRQNAGRFVQIRLIGR